MFLQIAIEAWLSLKCIDKRTTNTDTVIVYILEKFCFGALSVELNNK